MCLVIPSTGSCVQVVVVLQEWEASASTQFGAVLGIGSTVN